jgi:hypothetical protein
MCHTASDEPVITPPHTKQLNGPTDGLQPQTTIKRHIPHAAVGTSYLHRFESITKKIEAWNVIWLS